MASTKTWEIFEGFEDDGYLEIFPAMSGSLVTGPNGRGQAMDLTTNYDVVSLVRGTIGFRFYRQSDGWIVYHGGGTNSRHWGLYLQGGNLALWTGSTHNDFATQHWTHPAPDGWFYIELHFHQTNSGRFAIAIDGVTLFDSTIDALSNTVSTGLELRNVGIFDDMYIHNGFGDPADEFRGPIYVEKLLPNAAGFNTAWTGTYTDIDDAVADTANFISTATPGAAETNEYQNMTYSPETVIAVQYNFHAEGHGRVRPMYRSAGGTEGYGDYFWIPAEWAERRRILYTNPNTGVAWTQSDIDNGEFGVEAR